MSNVPRILLLLGVLGAASSALSTSPVSAFVDCVAAGDDVEREAECTGGGQTGPASDSRPWGPVGPDVPSKKVEPHGHVPAAFEVSFCDPSVDPAARCGAGPSIPQSTPTYLTTRRLRL